MDLNAASPTDRSTLRRRQISLGLTVAALLPMALGGLQGCAALSTLHADVSTYGTWPSGKAPGSFRIERLPSQQAKGNEQTDLEAAASAALVRAGFQPAAAGQEAEFVVQIGARVARHDRSPWDDPLWWHAWGPRWSGIAFYQPGWAWARIDRAEYEREVAVLIRERSSDQALYEARARSAGVSPGNESLFQALFVAALQEFPAVESASHVVTVTTP